MRFNIEAGRLYADGEVIARIEATFDHQYIIARALNYSSHHAETWLRDAAIVRDAMDFKMTPKQLAAKYDVQVPNIYPVLRDAGVYPDKEEKLCI